MRTIITLLLLVLLGGTAATAQHTHQHEAIELSNGQKWKVDANMMGYIREMEKDHAAFKGNTLAEYKTLAARLQKNVDKLTANCTMKGKAHDELHKWLLPYIDTVNSLGKAKTEKKAAEVYRELAASFAEFHRYFE